MPAPHRDFATIARHLTAERVIRLAVQLRRARADRSPDAVHDLRVAARRLLTTVDCFRSVRQGSEIRALRKRAKSVLAAGRSVRDRDIALELAAKAGLDPGSSLVSTLGRQREAAADALRARIDRKRFRDFAAKWAAAPGRADRKSLPARTRKRTGRSDVARYPNWNAAASGAANARRVLPGLSAAFFDMGRAICASDPSPADLHRLRLAGKRLRYCLELFRECYGPGMRKRLRKLRRIQRRLGVVSDCDATEGLLRSHELSEGAEAERLTGYLRARRSKNREAFLAFWRRRFDAPGEARSWADFLACPAEGNSA